MMARDEREEEDYNYDDDGKIHDDDETHFFSTKYNENIIRCF